MLKLWGMQSTVSLLLFAGPFWRILLASIRVLSMGQRELVDIETVYLC